MSAVGESRDESAAGSAPDWLRLLAPHRKLRPDHALGGARSAERAGCGCVEGLRRGLETAPVLLARELHRGVIHIHVA